MLESERQLIKEPFLKDAEKHHHGSLKLVATADLVAELREREGVKMVMLLPYQDYVVSETGPAIILVVTD